MTIFTCFAATIAGDSPGNVPGHTIRRVLEHVLTVQAEDDAHAAWMVRDAIGVKPDTINLREVEAYCDGCGRPVYEGETGAAQGMCGGCGTITIEQEERS